MQFIRTLWGNDGRRLKVNNDIIFALKQKYLLDFLCLTYGEDNHKQLIDLGIKSELISKDNRIFIKEQEFGHKIYTWWEASKQYNNFCFLD